MGSLSFPKVLVIIIFAVPLLVINIAFLFISILGMIAINRRKKSNPDNSNADANTTGAEDADTTGVEDADTTGAEDVDTTGAEDAAVQENFTQMNNFNIYDRTWYLLIPMFWSIIGIIASICLIILINEIPSNTQWTQHVIEEYARNKINGNFNKELYRRAPKIFPELKPDK